MKATGDKQNSNLKKKLVKDHIYEIGILLLCYIPLFQKLILLLPPKMLTLLIN